MKMTLKEKGSIVELIITARSEAEKLALREIHRKGTEAGCDVQVMDLGSTSSGKVS